MLKEKPQNGARKDIKKRRKTLNYIAFIKFWAMILIIRWHFHKNIKYRINFGARMCEILFVSSGFLVGYNYFKRSMPVTYYISCKYSYKHLRAFYPLHIINSFYSIFIYKGKINITYYEKLIFNFLLIKVYAMGFNGISWFINILLLCYFLSPLLLVGIKNINNSLIIFFWLLLFVLGLN